MPARQRSRAVDAVRTCLYALMLQEAVRQSSLKKYLNDDEYATWFEKACPNEIGFHNSTDQITLAALDCDCSLLFSIR